MVKVKNLHHTSDNVPDGYSSWKDYWEAKTGRKWPRYCDVYGCPNEAVVGAHVKKVGSYDNKWYIVPLCGQHNSYHNEDEFWVNENDLVPVSE